MFGVVEEVKVEAIAERHLAIKKTLTVEDIFLQDEQERRLYELREKALHDQVSMIAGARKEGQEEKALDTARTALKEGLTVDIIAKITGLTQETVTRLKQETS